MFFLLSGVSLFGWLPGYYFAGPIITQQKDCGKKITLTQRICFGKINSKPERRDAR
jgi:hypothetical protein